jgi:dTDP-4-dehydrorhamnose reductase
LQFCPDSLFVYISTASVFYGDTGDYTEYDVPNPKNFYSLTKLLGEFVVSESSLANWLIIRTNPVPRRKWSYPKAFTDRFGTYLYADDVAKAVQYVVDQKMRGIVHVCGDEKLSMFELARITTPEILPTTMREYVGPPLPVDMSLRSVRIRSFPLTRSQEAHPTLAD